MPDKYKKIKEKIKKTFNENQGCYKYRRTTMELRNRGYLINHKTVQKLMFSIKLKCMVRIKKYHFYRGKVEKTALNLINRNFHANKPNKKQTTDITEIYLFSKKPYLPPIPDMYNGEIINHSISMDPVLNLVIDMLDKALEKIPDDIKLILHSD